MFVHKLCTPSCKAQILPGLFITPNALTMPCKYLHCDIQGRKLYIQHEAIISKEYFQTTVGQIPKCCSRGATAFPNGKTVLESLDVSLYLCTSVTVLFPYTIFISISYSDEKPLRQCQINTWECLRYINGLKSSKHLYYSMLGARR